MPITLTPNLRFKIGIGTAITIAGVLITGAIEAQQTLTKINTSVGSVNMRIDSVTSKIELVERSLNEKLDQFDRTMQDRFTKTAAAEWALRMALSNPTMRIPDPRSPDKLLRGE